MERQRGSHAMPTAVSVDTPRASVLRRLGSDGVGDESHGAVRSITERLGLRVPATTKRGLRQPLDDVPVVFDEFDLAADDVRAVDSDLDLRNVAHAPIVALRLETLHAYAGTLPPPVPYGGGLTCPMGQPRGCPESLTEPSVGADSNEAVVCRGLCVGHDRRSPNALYRKQGGGTAVIVFRGGPS